MFKKLLSVLLAVMMVVSVLTVGIVNTAAATTDGFTPESTKLYFDVDGTGWEMGTRDKIAFNIFGGDFGTEANPTEPLGWGAKKLIGTATAGETGIFEFDPAAKVGYNFTPGVQYKIIFARVNGANWKEQTYDLLFTTDCFGHIAYSNGKMYENPVDSSKKALAAYWKDMDATKVGPVLQISSIGNVVGTCPEAGKTPESIFIDFLTVVDSVTGTTTYVNAKKYVVEPGNKTDQKLIDDIGAGLGLNKDQVQAAFTDNEVETTWSYDASTLPEAHKHTPGEPVQENVVPASCTAEGSYEEVVYCTECGEELSCEHKTIDKLAHTPGGEVIENREVTHDYTQYEVVHYCTECNTELSRETVQEPIITHTLTYVPEVPATEDSEGTKAHYTCSGCDKLFSDAAGTIEVSKADLVIPKLTHTHTPGEAVRENEVPATCTAEGSYEEVVYCTSCGAELSRVTKTIDKLAHTLSFKPGKQATEEAEGWKSHFVCSVCKKYFADANGERELTWDQIVIPKLAHTHTPGEAVQENVVPASCKAEGSYDEVVYCTECGEEISREHKTIDKLAHTPGEAVQENVVPATCTAEGSYDEVVYCTECGEEISREHKTIDMTKHTIKIKPGRAATTEADGWKTHFYCTECGKLFTNFSATNETTWENVRIPRIVTGKLGDVDGDGEVTVLDVTYLQRVLAGVKDKDATVEKLGDVDGDGDLNSIDVTKLQRWLLGLNQDLNIGTDV